MLNAPFDSAVYPNQQKLKMQSIKIIDDPNYLAYSFDFNRETIEFIEVSDGQIKEATWLNRDISSTDARSFSFSITEIMGAINAEPSAPGKPIQFIFHTAYCGSTFLSRCLALDNVSVGLREPQLLLDAANAKRLAWRSKTSSLDYRHLPTLALRLLQKHAGTDEALIIKPINLVNNIVDELLQANPASKALILYTDARRFLLSTLKKGEAAKQIQRSMFDLLRCDFPHLTQLSLSNAIHMSDLKLSLTLWRLQLEQAQQLLAYTPLTGRIKSLYSEALIDQPIQVLESANEFLNLGIAKDDIQNIAYGSTFRRDAKDLSMSFSAEAREQQYQAVEDFYGADLDNGYRWLCNNNPKTELLPELAEPLV